ncbi:MAG: hypothetical protein ACRYHA_20665 [Janthinobacterium lividum]
MFAEALMKPSMKSGRSESAPWGWDFVSHAIWRLYFDTSRHPGYNSGSLLTGRGTNAMA